jgi:CHAT domain-containing protein
MKKIYLIITAMQLISVCKLKADLAKSDSLFIMGDYAEAKSVFIQHIKAGDHDNATLDAYAGLIDCYLKLNLFDSAAIVKLKVEQFINPALSSNSPRYHNVLATMALFKSQYDLAEKISMQSITLSNAQQNILEKANALNTLGIIYWNNGNTLTAKEYINQALQLYQGMRASLTKQYKLASAFNNLGLVNASLEDAKDSETIDYFLKAIKIYESIFPDQHIALATEYINLAHQYLKKDNVIESAKYFEKAYHIAALKYKENHTQKAYILLSQAQLYLKQDNFKNATEYCQKAIEMYQSVLGAKHPNIAAALLLMAEINEKQLFFKLAIKYTHQALEANSIRFRSAYQYSHPSISEALDYQLMLGILLKKALLIKFTASNNTLSINQLKYTQHIFMSCDSLITYLRQHRINHADKLSLAGMSDEIYDHAADLCFILAENTFQTNKYHQLAFYFNEKNKASILQEAIADTKAKAFSGIPDQVIAVEDSLKIEITNLEQLLSNSQSPSQQQIVQNKLFTTRRSLDIFVQNLEKKYPQYFQLKHADAHISIPEIQQKINDSTSMLAYMVAESIHKLFVFVISKHKFKSYQYPYDHQLDRNISGLRNAIQLRVKPVFIQTSQYLHTALIPKIPARSSQLIIIPDGKLNNLNFEVLSTSRSKSLSQSYASLNYLINKYSVGYNYSATLSMSKYINNPSETVFLYAPIDFASNQALEPLPNTLKEVETIDSIFKIQRPVLKHVYAQANREKILNIKDTAYSIIHLATHGLVNEQEPNLSCIFTHGQNENNSIVYAGELYNVKLKASLVTLSACQTALGKNAKGEGIVGLSRALFYAGAHNILVSQWKVSDQGTQQYMQYFYQAYKQSSNPATATRIAKQKMLLQNSYQEPYFWAPFITISTLQLDK